ncbi:MAG: hypothetical protein HY043_15335 [Verrucomicrobia bacterium]|nr:hypothetical protein [Verrucomicrobiota bacterium]
MFHALQRGFLHFCFQVGAFEEIPFAHEVLHGTRNDAFGGLRGTFAKGTARRKPLQTIQGVQLSFGAARATSFTLLHQGPGEAAFSVLADGLTAKVFTQTGQSVGQHAYKVIGKNSVGVGAESLPLVVTIAQSQAA